MIAVTDTTFEDEVLASELPVVVLFGASWCQPCKALKPLLEELAGVHADKVKVVSADVDQAARASQANGVRGVPTLIAFRRGEAVAMAGGGIQPSRLRGFVESQAA